MCHSRDFRSDPAQLGDELRSYLLRKDRNSWPSCRAWSIQLAVRLETVLDARPCVGQGSAGWEPGPRRKLTATHSESSISVNRTRGWLGQGTRNALMFCPPLAGSPCDHHRHSAGRLPIRFETDAVQRVDRRVQAP